MELPHKSPGLSQKDITHPSQEAIWAACAEYQDNGVFGLVAEPRAKFVSAVSLRQHLVAAQVSDDSNNVLEHGVR
jgi:hypothetical protein